MTDKNYSYFVVAAIISAKLDQATKVAQKLSLTASNARAVALRAGDGAAGFRPLTDFIDRLADITVSSSKKINLLATSLSKTAADKVRVDGAIKHFLVVYDKAADSPYIDTLHKSFKKTSDHQDELQTSYIKQIRELANELDELRGELRTAVILATLSRVEASQAGVLYESALVNVADNVESAASEIKELINKSQELVNILQ